MGNRRQLWVSIGLVLGILLVLLVSPLLLLLIRTIYPADWATLSEIGQSYTAVSSLLSVLAIGGAVYSVILQTRQVEASQLQAAREMQFGIVQMGIDDPRIGKLYLNEDTLAVADQDSLAAFGHMTLVFRYLHYSYAVGHLDDRLLSECLQREYFNKPTFRAHWEQIRGVWSFSTTSRVDTQFVGIVEAALISSTPPQSVEDDPSSGTV